MSLRETISKKIGAVQPWKNSPGDQKKEGKSKDEKLSKIRGKTMDQQMQSFKDAGGEDIFSEQ